MSFKCTAVVTAFFAAIALPALAANGAPSLSQLIAACGKNVLCSNEQTSEGTLFRLRYPQYTQSLLCQEDGNCIKILARGQRTKVHDSLSQISAR